MSWRVERVGLRDAVLAQLRLDFDEARRHLAGTEKTLFEGARPLLLDAVMAQPSDSAVRVLGLGSSTPVYGPTGQPTGAVSQYLELKVEAIVGFVS